MMAMDSTGSTVMAVYTVYTPDTDAQYQASSLCVASNITAAAADHQCFTVSSYKDFGAGWFTCGNVTLTTEQYTPHDQQGYSADCGKNGIVTEVTNKASYAFTEPHSQAYAASVATQQCPALYDAVAATMSNLPPYSCTRTVYQPFFTSLATAAANATLLFHALVFLTAMLLPGAAALTGNKRAEKEETERESAREVQMTQVYLVENPIRAVKAAEK
jgi:hypothetical protein